MKIKEIMNKDPLVVYGGDTIQHVAEEMARSDHGMAVVLDDQESKKAIGVVSNKDVINKVIARKLSLESKFAQDIMTRQLISLDPEKTTSDAMYLMRKYNIKRIIVLDNDAVQGIITSNDILDAMIRYKKELLDMAIDF